MSLGRFTRWATRLATDGAACRGLWPGSPRVPHPYGAQRREAHRVWRWWQLAHVVNIICSSRGPVILGNFADAHCACPRRWQRQANVWRCLVAADGCAAGCWEGRSREACAHSASRRTYFRRHGRSRRRAGVHLFHSCMHASLAPSRVVAEHAASSMQPSGVRSPGLSTSRSSQMPAASKQLSPPNHQPRAAQPSEADPPPAPAW